jgi:PAS domain S-box-containing protein
MESNIMENTRYKVLFIEDNQLDQMAFKRFVGENDIPYDCIIASSVSEALQALDSNQGTAFEILKSVKNIPVIIVTGAGDEDTAIKAWKDGAYDYLIKDLDQNYLKAITITVENAIKHKMVEKKLQLLSGAVMSTDDSVYIANMQGKIIFVNKAFCVTYGYKEDEIIGEKAFCVTYGYKEDEIIGENSTVLWVGKQQPENTRSVFQTRTVGSSWEVGFYHKRKDDGVFPISLSRSTIKDSSGNEVAIVGVSRDISERILIEDELRTENQNLKKQIRELEEKFGIEHSCMATDA